MRLYELFLGGQSLRELIDEVASDVSRAVAGVDRADAEEVLRVMLLPRVKVTERCGTTAACRDHVLPEWPGQEPRPTEVPLVLECDDIRDLPKIFGATLADRLSRPADRAQLETELGDILERALRSVVFHNRSCRWDRACREVPLLFVLAGDAQARR